MFGGQWKVPMLGSQWKVPMFGGPWKFPMFTSLWKVLMEGSTAFWSLKGSNGRFHCLLVFERF
jgi:hypothetical protein